MRAARYLGVPIEEMEQMSVVWRARALVADEIENDERAKAQRRAERKASRGRGSRVH